MGGSDDRLVRVGDLVSTTDIADLLDVERVTVLAWRSRYPDFPEPLARIGSSLVWAWPDIKAWADARRPTD